MWRKVCVGDQMLAWHGVRGTGYGVRGTREAVAHWRSFATRVRRLAGSSLKPIGHRPRRVHALRPARSRGNVPAPAHWVCVADEPKALWEPDSLDLRRPRAEQGDWLMFTVRSCWVRWPGPRRWGRGRGPRPPGTRIVERAPLASSRTRRVMARDHISHARVIPRALGYCQPWDSHLPRARRAHGRHHPHFSPHLL